MLDSNTYYLNQYEHNQTILEQQWELTMKEKQEAVVELAIKLLKQETTPELFNWVFCEYLDGDSDKVLYSDLELIVEGLDTRVYHELDIIIVSLEGACMSLYDCELDEVDYNAKPSLLKQVLWGLK